MSSSTNADRYRGDPRDYDRFRPAVPAPVVEAVSRLAPDPLTRVLDLGCGTGGSTRPWTAACDDVIGMDANRDSIEVARSRGGARYEARSADDTRVADGSVDLVTVVQALHWMPGAAVLAEARRVLRPAGVLAAIDAAYPPRAAPDLDEAIVDTHRRAAALRLSREVDAKIGAPSQEDPLEHAAEHGLSAIPPFTVEHVEMRDADSIFGLVLTLGDVATMLRAGASEQELGLDRVTSLLPTEAIPLTWTWHVRAARRD